MRNIEHCAPTLASGLLIVKLLFKAPVTMPTREQMETVMQKNLGDAECFSYDSDTAVAQFAATRLIRT
ncbi:MAG: hypothetical protein ACTTJ4_08320 [Treponema sp.]|uniref:hypothetical protein n=1 Tax=Treponema sp. TaxID=166 RepID=UPI003FA25A4E